MEKKLRFRFSKEGMLRYLSHLDMVNIIIRAMRRAGIKAAYSKGFNPRPRITFGPPIPLGVESQAEYADVSLEEEISPDGFTSMMNCQLEGKVTISRAGVIPEEAKSLMSQVDIAEFEIILAGAGAGGRLEEQACRALQDPVLEDSIYEKEVESNGERGNMKIIIYGYTKTAKGRNEKVFKLRDFLDSLKSRLEVEGACLKKVVKKQLFILKDDKKLTPFEV